MISPNDTLRTFHIDNVRFGYEPYPVGYGADVFTPAVYAELLKHWPSQSLFEYKASLGHKYSLSEVNQPDNYHRFVAETPCWSDLHARIKSTGFVRHVLGVFEKNGIDLGLQHTKVIEKDGAGLTVKRLAAAMRYAAGRPPGKRLRSRFEFSMLPADGGNILPHTDAPGKLITLVFSMCADGEWNDAWGGGTSVLKPLDRSRSYNWVNRQLAFDDCEIVQTYPFNPNQCVVFVKTHNSLHAVHPMTGPAGTMRRTLTINIEEVVA